MSLGLSANSLINSTKLVTEQLFMATIFVRRRPDSVMEWGTEDVQDWLRELGLDKYCKRFQNHLVTGPVILQMDELLLDDLNISSAQDRHLLLSESARLCRVELVSVEADTQSPPSAFARVPSIQVTFDEEEDEETEHELLSRHHLIPADRDLWTLQMRRTRISNDDYNDDESGNRNGILVENKSVSSQQFTSGEADEVASRATLMVTMLSQENANLRKQLDSCSKNIEETEQLKDELCTIKVTKTDLEKRIDELEMGNTKLVDEIEELRLTHLNLQDAYRERGKLENEIKEAYETEIEDLRNENKLLREKLAKSKQNITEQEENVRKRNAENEATITMSTLNRANAPSVQENSNLSENREDFIDNDAAHHSLKLIEEVYKANKRCAELEDTVRWLHAELSDGNKLEFFNPNTRSSNEEEDQGPKAPEWPSLAGSSLIRETDEMVHSVKDIYCLDIMTGGGLPTGSEDDIWTRKTSEARRKTLEDPDELLLHYWNV